jgi:hypothetical protein
LRAAMPARIALMVPKSRHSLLLPLDAMRRLLPDVGRSILA